jgi:hypothetical protein
MYIPEVIRKRLSPLDLAALQDIPDNGLAWYRDHPDDALLPSPAGFRDAPHRRYARTPDELRRLIRRALARFPGADPAAYEDQIVHETEHAAAAQALGCTSRFWFTVAPNPAVDDLSVWYTQAGHSWASPVPLTKLAVAAIAAAPARLSDGDLADLYALGYRGADDVAKRIRRSGQTLPMPAGAQTNRRLRRFVSNW